jgi:D-sedoheptulose 7-phosphate isomerase
MTDLSLGARADSFRSILASVEVTDAAGRRLDTEDSLAQIMDLLRDLRARKGSLYVVGNGGSAAVASHSVVDFLKVGALRAFTLTDASVLTAMANDVSYGEAFEQMLSVHAQPGDALIAISSSGSSVNIVNAAAKVKALGGSVVTLSGFAPDNPLRSRGDLNVWLDSRDFGMVEAAHQFILHVLIDRLWHERDAARST